MNFYILCENPKGVLSVTLNSGTGTAQVGTRPDVRGTHVLYGELRTGGGDEL